MAQRSDDPVLTSARREAVAVFATWLAALLYTIGYCSLYGYERPLSELEFVFGIPEWVFWGVVAPWGVCLVISFWFAYALIRDEDLEREGDTIADPAREAGDV